MLSQIWKKMNAPRRLIQIVQIILISLAVKTTSPALSHEAYCESKTKVNIVVLLNNSNAESYCQAPPFYSPKVSERAEHDESKPSFSTESITPSTRSHRKEIPEVEENAREKITKKIWRVLDVGELLYNSTPSYSTDLYFKLRKIIKPLLFEKGRNVPRYKYTLVFPTKVESPAPHTSIPSTKVSFEFTLNSISQAIVSADFWFLNGNFDNRNNWFQMELHEINVPSYSNSKKILINDFIWSEGGAWHKVSVMSQVRVWATWKIRFTLELTCSNCDQRIDLIKIVDGMVPFIFLKSNTSQHSMDVIKESSMKDLNRYDDYDLKYRVLDHCKRGVTIDFTKTKLKNSIIWPKRFTTNYCLGVCSTNYDKRICTDPSIEREKRVKDTIPFSMDDTTCCEPVETEPLEVIYYKTAYIIVYESVPDIMIQECGCLW